MLEAALMYDYWFKRFTEFKYKTRDWFYVYRDFREWLYGYERIYSFCGNS